MAMLTINNGNLTVTMQGMRKVWTLKSELTFPLSSVRGVTHDPTISADYPKMWEKKLGTNLFNTYYGGTFKQDGDTIFWDVRKPGNTVVITIEDEDFQRLVIKVDDPKTSVRELEQALNTNQ